MPRARNPEIVKGLLCFGRVMIDEQCNLAAPSACFDSSLKVDIGGNVTMQATTINFKNATIDFDGATLENFTGNISGNISGNLDVDSVNALVVNADKMNGNLCGNIVADFITGGLYTGCVCGDIVSASISEKTPGGNITFTGNIVGNTIGLHTGNVVGNFCGIVISDTIVPKTGAGVTITGNTVLNGGTIFSSGDIFLSDNNTFFIGNMCGDLFTSNIHPKTPGGNIDMTEGNVLISNVVGGDFYGNFFGNVIGNIFPFDTIGNFFGNFTGNSFGKFTGNVCGNIDANLINSNVVISNIGNIDSIMANVICANAVTTDCIESKASGNIIIKDNTRFDKLVTVLGNLSTANLTVSQTFSASPGTLITADICGNLTTDIITAKANVIGVSGALTVSGNVQSAGFIIGSSIGKHTGNVCGNVSPAAVSSAVGIDGDLNITGDAVYVDGEQILTSQQTAIADAAAATAASLTDSTGETPDQTIDDVDITVGTVSATSAAAPGAVSVTSTAATDLDTTRTELVSLTTEVNTALGLVDDRLGTINENFSDLTDEVNNLITDVADIRTQLNTVLTALRTHGLIDT